VIGVSLFPCDQAEPPSGEPHLPFCAYGREQLSARSECRHRCHPSSLWSTGSLSADKMSEEKEFSAPPLRAAPHNANQRVGTVQTFPGPAMAHRPSRPDHFYNSDPIASQGHGRLHQLLFCSNDLQGSSLLYRLPTPVLSLLPGSQPLSGLTDDTHTAGTEDNVAMSARQ